MNSVYARRGTEMWAVPERFWENDKGPVKVVLREDYLEPYMGSTIDCLDTEQDLQVYRPKGYLFKRHDNCARATDLLRKLDSVREQDWQGLRG